MEFRYLLVIEKLILEKLVIYLYESNINIIDLFIIKIFYRYTR